MLALLPLWLLAQPVHYAIDPEHTELLALTAPAGLLGGASHPHVIVARRVMGEVIYDASSPAASSVTLEFQVDALENDAPALRKRLGLRGELTEEERRTVSAAMRAEGQLDVKRHPRVSFTSKHVTRLDDASLEVHGTMTLRGVAVELTLPVKVSVRDGVLHGEGTVGLTHAMFGFKPFSTALGTIRNAEEISLRLKLAATARSSTADGGH
jgi:polyisoprenoid-binding protein YceI